MNNFIYFFDDEINEDKSFLREKLGGKGASLTEMTNLGIAVPYGFTISTNSYHEYHKDKDGFIEKLLEDVKISMGKIEEKTGKKFNDKNNPLLLSVRSGAKVSMPGMMDTILNLGINKGTVLGLAKIAKSKRFAYDSYRRFLQMFGDTALGISSKKFEKIIQKEKVKNNIKNDADFSVEILEEICEKFINLIEFKTGDEFDENPYNQLKKSMVAVFDSWDSNRAKKYREIHNISDEMGTAINIQSMVFGNLGNDSGTGVVFTRNPANGERKIFGEYLVNAQGEDIVAGIRTPKSIKELEKEMPNVFFDLKAMCEKLEKYNKNMMDIEFTVEKGKLFLLQSRSGKRTANASVKIASDMIDEKIMSEDDAIMSIDVQNFKNILHSSIKKRDEENVVAVGLPASPGASSGKVVFSSDDALTYVDDGEKVILVRRETSPEDISGMHVSEGILTSCGGMTSHAAVVARGMGKPCIVGAIDLIINHKDKKIKINDIKICEGDVITIDGGNGEIIKGNCEIKKAKISDEAKRMLSIAKKKKQLKVFANSDTPRDAEIAKEFGAEGIGLCRTEHMFFDEDRIKIMRKMILAENKTELKDAVEELKPMQQMDFEKIFKVMDGFSVAIRLLDPPLHEFLPHKNNDIEKEAKILGFSFEELKDRIKKLEEVNPMLGHRGARLLISYPEIIEMQVDAIIRAAIYVQKMGKEVIPEIMLPLIGIAEEFVFLREIVLKTAKRIFFEERKEISFKIGIMMEIPRACLIASELSKDADFCSFGTNDLTQMSFGFSRDDIARFLSKYKDLGIIKSDPFEVIDAQGVGYLIKKAVKDIKKTNKINKKISVCGEHGGNPESIDFFHKNDFDVISCSPYRIPVAIIASAQSAILKKR